MSDPQNILLFLSYFGTAVVLFAAFLAAYTLATHIKEWELIRSGNTATKCRRRCTVFSTCSARPFLPPNISGRKSR